MSDSQKIARAVVEKIRSDRASRGTIMAQWMVDEWVALVTPVIEEAEQLSRIGTKVMEQRAQAAEKERDEWREALRLSIDKNKEHAEDKAALKAESERLTQRVRELEAGLSGMLESLDLCIGEGSTLPALTKACIEGFFIGERDRARRLLSQPPAPQPSAIVCAQIIPQSSPPDEASPNADHGTARRHCVCCGCSIPACWAAGMCVPCATEECSCAGPNDEPSEPAPPATRCDVTDLDGFPCDAKTPCNLHPSPEAKKPRLADSMGSSGYLTVIPETKK